MSLRDRLALDPSSLVVERFVTTADQDVQAPAAERTAPYDTDDTGVCCR